MQRPLRALWYLAGPVSGTPLQTQTAGCSACCGDRLFKKQECKPSHDFGGGWDVRERDLWGGGGVARTTASGLSLEQTMKGLFPVLMRNGFWCDAYVCAHTSAHADSVNICRRNVEVCSPKKAKTPPFLMNSFGLLPFFNFSFTSCLLCARHCRGFILNHLILILWGRYCYHISNLHKHLLLYFLISSIGCHPHIYSLSIHKHLRCVRSCPALLAARSDPSILKGASILFGKRWQMGEWMNM